MIAVGYFLSILIGVSLGLMGSGGSILTVPLLVYFFKIDPLLAASYSLIIVGFTSLIGITPYVKDRNIDYKSVLSFGIPSIVAVFLTKYFLIPLIPEKIAIESIIEIKRDFLVLLFLSLILLISAFSMIRKKNSDTKNHSFFTFKLIFQGTITGFITGVIGIGGGFLIIPVLVKVCHIPMKKAVGTSLLIIVLNAVIGLLAVKEYSNFNVELLISILFFALLGMIIGVRLSRKIDGNKLKVIFGWFVLIMGLTILGIELVKLM
ncbi:MAG: sulfite exporter TauE/SafE family protein [Bacteroidota bacterium]